jgi:hypothetical protein
MNDREQFEAWYVENVFDLQADPVGSRLCGLQWKAWQAARATPAQPTPEKLAQPKPCPRCENDAPTINSSASVRLSEIHCGDCGFVLQRPVDEDAIITIWNVLPRQMTDEKISQFIENADGVRCVDGEYRIEGRDLMNLVREIIKEVTPTGAFQPSPSSVGAAKEPNDAGE